MKGGASYSSSTMSHVPLLRESPRSKTTWLRSDTQYSAVQEVAAPPMTASSGLPGSSGGVRSRSVGTLPANCASHPGTRLHRSLFEHKVAEALRLVRSLGANRITVLHIKGWDRNAAANIGLNVPQIAGLDLHVGAEASRIDAAGHQILTSMKLAPTRAPSLPKGLVWFPHEPLWAEVADGRLESGLEEFVVDVRTTEDFGVNATLKTLISKVGLEAGGKFVEHTNTVWRLEGTFS
jgi:hypothetical protein